MRKYLLTSDRWSRFSIECTFAEIQEQAEIYERDRGIDEETPVAVTEKIRNGKNVVIDETGEIIAEEIN